MSAVAAVLARNPQARRTARGVELPVVLSTGDEFVLDVCHEEGSAPELHTTPEWEHPWLDEQGRLVGCPSLYLWPTVELCDIVEDVINELTRHPPVIRRVAFAVPVNFARATLQGLSSEELQAHNTPHNIDRLFKDSSLYSEVSSANRRAFLENVECARANLEQAKRADVLRARVESLKTQLAEARATRAGERRARRKQDVVCALQNLRASSSHADSSSERIAEAFHNNESSLNEFTSEFIATRTEFHIAKALTYLLEQ